MLCNVSVTNSNDSIHRFGNLPALQPTGSVGRVLSDNIPVKHVPVPSVRAILQTQFDDQTILFRQIRHRLVDSLRIFGSLRRKPSPRHPGLGGSSRAGRLRA